MLFPDTRHDDYYNQDFLDGNDTSFIEGYDAAVETLSNVLANDFESITDESDYLEDVFKKQLPESLQTSYERYTYNGEIEKREVTTYGEYIFMKLLEELENERDSTIVSFIDHTCDDDQLDKEYRARRNKVLKENAESDNPKEYYDTRKYMVTGKKEASSPEEDDE